MDKRLCKYEIADISKKEQDALKKAELILKEETGKDFILIAWEDKQ